FVVGAALLVRGLAGRRVGDEPRCRRCRYNLTNLESDKCPECGLKLSPGAVRIGLWHRRRPSIALGTIALALGGVLIAPATERWVASGNWYRYLPTSWVLKAAAKDSLRAFEVIDQRCRNGKLSKAQLNDVAEVGLERF